MFSLALHRHQVLELKAHCSERQRAWAGPRTACVQSGEGADGRSGPSAVKETKTGRLPDRLILGKWENESKRTLFLESTVRTNDYYYFLDVQRIFFWYTQHFPILTNCSNS